MREPSSVVDTQECVRIPSLHGEVDGAPGLGQRAYGKAVRVATQLGRAASLALGGSSAARCTGLAA